MSLKIFKKHTLEKQRYRNIKFKKIIHFNFFTKFFGRILFQRSYKTLRLFSNLKRLSGTVWVDSKKELFDIWAEAKNKELYIEALNFYSDFSKERKKKIKGLPISGGDSKATRGGGANEALLYFLVRLINANKVLETGVSAGSSSRCILEALKVNNGQMLYSSDLATVLEKSQVGILVTESLRKKWFLAHNGDRENLPIIFNKETTFDLIYYDSEKTYSAKKWFHEMIIKNPLPKILVYDDIDRDKFFSECVNLYGYNYKVFNNAGVIFF